MQDDAKNIQAPSSGGILIWLSRLWRNRGGAMAMEFAITAPIFLTFLMAVFEFGRYYLISSTVQYAVEDIGRFAMSHYTREYWADKENAGGDTHFTGLVDAQLEADAGSRIFGSFAGSRFPIRRFASASHEIRWEWEDRKTPLSVFATDCSRSSCPSASLPERTRAYPR